MGKGGREAIAARAPALDEHNLRRADFIHSVEDEPHALRRMKIVEAHPEIRQLFGPEWRTKYLVFATVALQTYFATAAWVGQLSWGRWLALTYVVGATANHSLFLAVHEISHNLAFKNLHHNRYLAMIANLPIGIAYSVTFKPYHMEHHKYQGSNGVDTDIPTPLEAWLITGSATCRVDHSLRKAVFMFLNIFAYALRPMIVKPDLVPKDSKIALNWMIQLTYDALLFYFGGFGALGYMLISTFLAGSIHPTAGHFLAEHYVVEGDFETYSYYGWLNILAYNVGYHNEHHDFPNIPWSRLPLVREMAPEFYDDLPRCESWPGLIVKYITDDNVGAFSRVKREPAEESAHESKTK